MILWYNCIKNNDQGSAFYEKILSTCVTGALLALSLTFSVSAYSDPANGDWSQKSVILKNTSEAELVVRTGDIDACNDEYAVSDNKYDPFTANNQYAHGYPWVKDEDDPAGSDCIFVGSSWKGEGRNGYSSNYISYKNGDDTTNAYGDGALSLSMEYDASGITVNNAILQLCIDDFQANSFDSVFTVTLNGKNAPFIAELFNHTDQTGPTAYIISAIIPSAFYENISSGKLTIVIDETTGIGDGYAIDFAKLLINYDDKVFTGTFSGTTEPGATVRLLGTSTTVTASSDGGFTFSAIPGINAVRASKNGFTEKYDSGIVLSSGTEWNAEAPLEEGSGEPDIDFSEFGVTSGSESTNDASKVSEDISAESEVVSQAEQSAEKPAEQKASCPVCHFCPQPLGLCIFIWLLIAAAVVAVIVVVIIVVKKKNKKENK